MYNEEGDTAGRNRMSIIEFDGVPVSTKKSPFGINIFTLQLHGTHICAQGSASFVSPHYYVDGTLRSHTCWSIGRH